jgi:tetratricopeptide (TPR) repeat protein
MKPLLALLFILCSFCGLSQQKKIDSLLAVNNNYGKEDSQKVIHLINIFRQYGRQNNFNGVEEYGAKALQLAQKLPQTTSLSYVYLRLALCYHGKEKYVKAIEYYNKGIEVAQKRNDKNEEAGIYLNLSALFGSIPDYAKSLEASQLAVGLYNALGDQEQISSCYMNIGAIYLDIKDPVKAVNYINKALTIFKTQGKDGLNYGTAIAYQSIGNAYQLAADNELLQLGINPFEKNIRSIENYNEALKVTVALEEVDEVKASINNDIGQLYEKMGNRALALQHYITALQFAKAGNNKQGLADVLYSMGNFYLNEKDYEKSKIYLDQSLQIGNDNDFLSVQQNVLEKISALFEQTKRFDSAIDYYKRYIAVKNKITDKEKEKDIARKQLQIDFSVKENEKIKSLILILYEFEI